MLIAVIVCTLFVALLMWAAARSMYYPFRYPRGDWSARDRLRAEDVWLAARDGVRLHAWWIAARAGNLATLYLHGNGGNITHREAIVPVIAAAGSSVLLLEYRGYGRSDGRPSENGLYADADAGYDHLVARGYDPRRIVIHGESLGTAVAVDLAARRPCAGLVLASPFTSAQAVAHRVLPLLGPMLVWSYNSKRKIRRVRAPVLVLHGDRDEVIDFEFGRELYEAAPEPKLFWRVTGAAHNDLIEISGPEYTRRLRDFYQTLG
ncbi:MAG TPA: alpha/beta hydrolase [Bryobacteraceae bacterium]|nr:alpha/beta hydrolase [Bryobacteraceae bacterium]